MFQTKGRDSVIASWLISLSFTSREASKGHKTLTVSAIKLSNKGHMRPCGIDYYAMTNERLPVFYAIQGRRRKIRNKDSGKV